MSHFAYFAPLVATEEEIWTHREIISEHIEAFTDDYAAIGLKRGVHYCIVPLSVGDILDLITDYPKYPCKFPLIEIGFRSKRVLDMVRSSGTAQDANEDAAEVPIWGGPLP